MMLYLNLIKFIILSSFIMSKRVIDPDKPAKNQLKIHILVAEDDMF